MCDPVIAGGAMLAMSGIQAYTQYQQGMNRPGNPGD